MVDVKCLSDDELQNELDKFGFSPGPILSSTRKVKEKKLVQLLVSTPCASPEMNGPRELDRAQDYDDSEGTIRSCTAGRSQGFCKEVRARFAAGRTRVPAQVWRLMVGMCVEPARRPPPNPSLRRRLRFSFLLLIYSPLLGV
uniref:LEM domain-containing protein 1 n=1 Tax=Tursiops truncatus TaxID=9739 RepID=A0A6J3RFC2_TURTR|nr:LEM domain-containing protein 1 [Tursiops truncatus]